MELKFVPRYLATVCIYAVGIELCDTLTCLVIAESQIAEET